MSLRWDRILDRLWLALSGGAAVTVALHGGAHLGLRGWPAGSAVLAAQAAAPGESVRAPASGTGCREAGPDPLR
jgi:hypothetical protein